MFYLEISGKFIVIRLMMGLFGFPPFMRPEWFGIDSGGILVDFSTFAFPLPPDRTGRGPLVDNQESVWAVAVDPNLVSVSVKILNLDSREILTYSPVIHQEIITT
jgi:hypothetical protein